MFSPSPEAKVPNPATQLCCGIKRLVWLQEKVVLGLKCELHGWSLKGHEMRVRSMHEVGSVAHLTERAAQGDLVLGRRF